jgi:uncharacterized protein YndB with AHSA1/START domain
MSQAVDVSPVVQSVEIGATPDRVFELFTEPDQLVKWWPDAVRLEPRVGGKMHMTFEGRGEVWGEITTFEPGRALGFTWIRGVAPEITTRVDVSFEDLGGGRTRVELVPYRLGGRAGRARRRMANDPRRRLEALPRLPGRPG